jgi:hypothetical protein
LIPETGNLKLETGHTVVIGCDVAKHTDWTVLIAMDAETGRCLEMARFNQLDWPIQKERIVGFARKWRGRLILDATGVGDPIYDDLKRVLPDIEGFKFTSPSKVALVQRLVVAIEQRKVSWPGGRKLETGNLILETGGMGERSTLNAQRSTLNNGEWEVLTNELKRYEYAVGPTGQISYSAPAGFHDDCVMALALANHRRWETENCGHFLRLACGWRGRTAPLRVGGLRRERCLDGY